MSGEGNSFPNLLKLATDGGMILSIPSYCERVFSPQNLINCQKSRLLAERLDILMLISDEGAPLKFFPFGLALRK